MFNYLLITSVYIIVILLVVVAIIITYIYMYICILCTHIIWVPTNSPRPSPLGGSSSLVVPRIVTVKGGAWADMLLGLDLLRKEPGWAGAFERCPWVWR